MATIVNIVELNGLKIASAILLVIVLSWSRSPKYLQKNWNAKKKHLVKVGCFLAEFWLWFQLKFLKNLNKKKYPKKWFPEFFFQKFIAEWFQFFIDNKYDQKCQKIMLVWSMYKKLELFRNGSLKKKSPKLSFSVGRYIVKISSYVLTLICTLGVSPSLVSRYCDDYRFRSIWGPYI